MVKLPAEAEEYATAFERITTHGGGTAPRFRANFWSDWRRMLPAGCPITSLDGCDFSRLLVAAEKSRVKLAAQRKKAAEKVSGKATEKGKVIVAIVDGVPQPISGGAVVEAGSVFVGRGGEHPLAGRIKRRIGPSDVTLNLGKGAKVPPGDWAAIVHDPHVDWLARWRDPLLDIVKYVRLSAAAGSEQNTTRVKFERARTFYTTRLHIAKKHIAADIRLLNEPKKRQIATCAWLLMRTALRVGSPSESRVVGLTTMTTDHVALTADGQGLAFDFLGKDSVPYRRSLTIDDPVVLGNLKALLLPRPKRAKPAFPLVTSADLNAYLGGFMKGLTAKDIRTAMASAQFEATIDRVYGQKSRNPKMAALAVLIANIRIAFLCNHRKMTATDAASLGDDNELAERIDALEARAAKQKVSSIHIKAIEKDAKELVKQFGLALATSRANYIDPRIATAFSARAGLPLRLALPGAALAAKFSWATSDASFRWGQQHTVA
jgi:DNA topoisomerase-1